MTDAWLVAIDLDGTTIDEAGDASRDVVGQLRRVERVGHHLLIATGRSATTTLPVLDRIGTRPEYVVCSNGAVILQRNAAAPADITGFTSRVSMPQRCWKRCAHLPEARIAVEDEDGVYRYTHPFPPATTGVTDEQVAMGHAPEALRAVATEATGTFAEDGLAGVLATL